MQADTGENKKPPPAVMKSGFFYMFVLVNKFYVESVECIYDFDLGTYCT